MSDYGPPERYCVRKRQYDKKTARLAAQRMRSRERLPMKFYRCPNCGWFHVAHAIPLKRPRDWRNDNA